MSFLKRLVGALESPPAPAVQEALDPKWARSPSGRFHRLLSIGLDIKPLSGVGGVYVIWHQGVKPGWVHVGATTDLGRALADARDDPEVLSFESRGGLYVTWSPVVADFRTGVAAYLQSAMSPVIDRDLPADTALRKAEPIPVKMPN